MIHTTRLQSSVGGFLHCPEPTRSGEVAVKFPPSLQNKWELVAVLLFSEYVLLEF